MLTFAIYEADDGWRWTLRGRNNRIVADSGEAYTRQRDCERAVDKLAEQITERKFRVIGRRVPKVLAAVIRET